MPLYQTFYEKQIQKEQIYIYGLPCLALEESLSLSKGTYQKLLSGFFPLRGGGYPPIPLSFFGHNDFPLRGGGEPPNSIREKIR